ncbi:unnamed protein product [Durusdinium trenchii]|uniref:Uncharacterized protein n=1 Tax=Durusdinium trenchii TaxID=1381693 RepID=A0ABP0NRG1_9DINO
MELQHYALKPPYTRTYFTVPSHAQDTLRRNGLSPVQADGECLTALIMAAHYGPSEEAELPMALFEPFLVIDPAQTPTGVVSTEFLNFLIHSTLDNMPQPTTPQNAEEVALAFARLAHATAQGRHSMTYNDGGPQRTGSTGSEPQSSLFRRLIAHMAPYANEIPHLQSIHGPDLFQEYMDLLGDTRFRTLRVHCLGLEELIRMGFNQIPWDAAAVRALLNKLRDTEATPHKIQRIWDTLRWFSKRFGLLDVASLGRLQEKRKALQDQLTPTVSKPQRKAMVPSKEVIWALECGAVACSARFNDLQHTSTSYLQISSSTIELNAWQTKTVSAFKMKKSPAFVDSGYLIPTLSKDGLGLIPRPSSPDRALRWLKAALGRQGLRGPQVENLSWHSFRVFIPDCAFQLHIPQDLGRSPPERPLRPTPESTASWEMVDAEKIPADSVADASGPLRVIATTLRKKGTYLFKVHLLDNQGKTIGRGWPPNLARVNELTSDEYIANIDAHLCCERCFKHHTFPADWQTPSAPHAPLPTEASSASSPDSEDSLTDDSVDTASEAEKERVDALSAGVKALLTQKGIPYWVVAQAGYTTMEDLADWDTPALARQHAARDLNFAGNDHGWTNELRELISMRMFQCVRLAKETIGETITGLGRGPDQPLLPMGKTTGLDAVCDRKQILVQPRPKLTYQGSDNFLKKQFKLCAHGKIGFFLTKQIISALPDT